MKKLLTDIELDFYELKCLLDFLDKNPNDKTLYKVAARSLHNLKGRMNELENGFQSSYPKYNIEETISEPVVETTVEKIEAVTVEPKVKEEPIKEDTKDLEPDKSEVEEIVVKTKKVITQKDETAAVKESSALYKALSLNDIFRYSRELFDGDTNLMRKTFSEMDHLGSYEQAIGHLVNTTSIDTEDLAFQDLDEFLKRYFS